jgi:hypothetical protein
MNSKHFPALCILSAVLLCAGCATPGDDLPEPRNPPRKENFFAVTADHRLVSFNAGQPGTLLSDKPLTGLAEGEEVKAIDYRVAKGVLYALLKSATGARLATIDTATGKVNAVGAPFAVMLEGEEFGFDFNPTVDRIRVVSNTGQNLRLHPDTGAVVDANPNQDGLQIDPRLSYAGADAGSGKTPRVVAAAYTYNKVNDKITTNYAIDATAGTLVTQGSLEGAMPVVSPNTGRIFTVGSLGIGPFSKASFDIADTTGAAFIATTPEGRSVSRFFVVDLATGKATFMGTIGSGRTVRGISFEP